MFSYIQSALLKRRKKVMVEICAVLGCYAAYGVNSLPTFRDSLSVRSSRDSWHLIMVPIYCTETSVRN